MLEEKYVELIQARIDGEDFPLGLRKQYELQLEQIKAQAPSLELLLFPCIGFSMGE